MGERTEISWCDHTYNPWIGCAKVSPACDGCYAEHMMDTRMGRLEWGAPGSGAGTRSRTSVHNRNEPYRWNRRALAMGTRPFVFCLSLGDVFDNQVPAHWRTEAFQVMRETPALVYLLLTKRPQLIYRLAEEAGGLPPNAALGVTVEDQERADRNVPALLDAAAALNPIFTFLSCEPLLGPLDIDQWIGLECRHEGATVESDTGAVICKQCDDMPLVDWVIMGGETDQGAHKARPMRPTWDRLIRDHCAAAGVPFHRKQWGEWSPNHYGEYPFGHWHGDHFALSCACGEGTEMMCRVGKANAGRALDGHEHLTRPAVPALEMAEA